MADHKKSKGPYRSPPEQYRFSKGISGNPKGRPKKEASASCEAANVRDLLVQMSNRPVPMEIGGERREIPYGEALCHQLAMAALVDPRIGLRVFLELAASTTPRLPDSKEDEDENEDLLSNPIVQREIQRELRRLLQKEGEADRAAEIMDKAVGSTTAATDVETPD